MTVILRYDARGEGVSIQDRNNSAARLSRLLTRLRSVAPTRTVLDTWALAFSVPEGLVPGRKAFVVADLIRSTFDELLRTERAAEAPGFAFPVAFSAETFRSVEAALSAVHLGHQWSSLVGNIQDKHLAVLEAIAHVMPDDEEPIAEADIAAVHASLDALEQSAREPDAPAAIRSFVREQVSRMRLALWESKIRGAAALRDAVYQTAMAAQENDDVAGVADQPTRPSILVGLGTAWKRVADIAEGAEKAGKVWKFGKRLVEVYAVAHLAMAALAAPPAPKGLLGPGSLAVESASSDPHGATPTSNGSPPMPDAMMAASDEPPIMESDEDAVTEV